MTKVLLTGGSGFVSAHILDTLLEQGYSVVTTVRSESKANQIRNTYPNTPKSRLDFAIVEDVAKLGAFDKAVRTDPPLDTVIHTASPFRTDVTDIKRELLDPAIIGTTELLKATKRYAPQVTRMVITSSFAAIIDGNKGNSCPEHTYTEEDWNPITEEGAYSNVLNGYRASKTFAERAAWSFMENERPNFTLTTICPPLVFGPLKNHLDSLDHLNTSNQRVRNFIRGDYKTEIPDTGSSFFVSVDVRDLALAHVRAMERPEAADQRFFYVGGYFSNKEICEIIRKNFPEYSDRLPGREVQSGGYPEAGLYKFSNSKSREVLGVTDFRPLEESIAGLVRSLKDCGM